MYRKMASAGSSSISCLESTVELQLRAKLDEAKRAIEEQRKTSEMLTSQVEQM